MQCQLALKCLLLVRRRCQGFLLKWGGVNCSGGGSSLEETVLLSVIAPGDVLGVEVGLFVECSPGLEDLAWLECMDSLRNGLLAWLLHFLIRGD